MSYALIFLIYATTAFLIALQALVVWKIAVGKLDLRLLIANEQGNASLSRLQLLIFTFVIAAGFLYLTAKAEAFPTVNEGVLFLLGISGTTYALGKALDRHLLAPTLPFASAPKTEAKPAAKNANEPSQVGPGVATAPPPKAKAS